MIDKKLLEVLACPVCKAGVDSVDGYIVCSKCKRHYPVRDDIPVMLVDQAVMLDENKREG